MHKQKETLISLLALVGTLSSFVYMVGMALDLATVKLLVKGIPALSLAAWVWVANAEQRTVAIGLIFGALGDILLNIPGAFLPGMIAFAIGHGLYVVAFWRWHKSPRPILIAPVALYLAFGLSLMLPGTGDLTIPVVLYMGIIGAMIWRAAVIATDITADPVAKWFPIAGALLFGFSDTLIGVNRFAVPLPGAAYPIIVTYWLGQGLIAAGAVARARAPR